MGTYVTQTTTPSLFTTKTAAPGASLKPGWTTENVIASADLNGTQSALLDSRTELRGLNTNLSHNGTVDNTGVSDASTTVQAWLVASTSSAVDAYVPKGTYLTNPATTGVLRPATGSHMRGQGPELTKFKSSATGWIYQSSISFPRRNLVIENLGFDTNSVATGAITVLGAHVDHLIIRNCVFRHKNTYGINLSGVRRVEIENCVFYGGAVGNSAQCAIAVSAGVNSLRVSNCDFIACENGLVVDTGTSLSALENLCDGLRIENCYSDGLWYVWPSQMSNSGGTVSYVVNPAAVPPTGVLTDSAANFSTGSFWDQFDTPVRVLPLIRTGTLTTTTSLGAELTDAGATFVTSGVIRGDLLRATGKFALVTNRKSETSLYHGGWFDSTTYEPTTAPTSGSYTLYKVLLAKYFSKTSTTITTYSNWADCDGNLADISGGSWVVNGINYGTATGTLYEVATFPNYAFVHVENSSVNTQIHGNRVYRGYGDAISCWGNQASITSNTVVDCQDVSITLNGTTGEGHSLVANNTVIHPGAIGIYVGSGESCSVSNNLVSRPVWTNFVNLYNVGGILVQGFPVEAKRLLISGNKVDCDGRATARAGICLYASTGAISDSTLQGNDIRGAQYGAIVIDGSTVTGTRLRDNTLRDTSSTTAIVHRTSAVGADYGILRAADYGGVVGTPESVITAGIGTMYLSNAGALYMKTTGTGNTGWTLIS